LAFLAKINPIAEIWISEIEMKKWRFFTCHVKLQQHNGENCICGRVLIVMNSAKLQITV